MNMFCYQCEQAAGGKGCDRMGVCGKDPLAAALQDALLLTAKGVSMYAFRARQLGGATPDADQAVVEALFTTVTNVNFDPPRLWDQLTALLQVREATRTEYEQAAKARGIAPSRLDGPAVWVPRADAESTAGAIESLGIAARKAAQGDDVTGLQELLTYGLKGMAAYADHAMILGREDDAVFAFFHEALDALSRENLSVDDWLGLVLRCGEVNLRVMELLDEANTGAYGNPEPTAVRIHPLRGKAILVSGHDLKDLEVLLQQTENSGIQVYTHGEMLPAHGYPGLKRFKHLAGNYGGAWQDQQKEFVAFPGSILMTTNCIQKPRDVYQGRIFTSGLVAWPGVRHIADHDFKPVIAAAQAAEGFHADGPDDTILVGFGHGAVLGVADKVIAAVKQGDIRHFFLVGGCDGAKPGRNYYTDFAENVPPDCMILTLACGKFRFNKLDFGTVAGLPRLLDVGQCNDAYSAIRIAGALAEAFGVGINDLPLSMILSWYEQKAVCILLTLLHLGVRNIRLGPSLPAFVTPAVLNVLVEKFAIAPITTAEADLKSILG